MGGIWRIVNGRHWRLAVTFREDHSRSCSGYRPGHVGLQRHLSLTLLKRKPFQQSLTQKPYQAATNDGGVVKVLLRPANPFRMTDAIPAHL